MLAPKFIPYVLRQVVRHRTRTLLTVAGVSTAMFLFCAVQAMQAGVREATGTTSKDATLVVYRQNRYCPATSRLPEHYLQRIERVPGVAWAIPTKIEVTNCGASLDVITFRGVPPEHFTKHYAPNLDVIEGSADAWTKRGDAALVGETLAKRRGWKVGDSFSAVGVECVVAGIVRSAEPQDQNVAFVHLPRLQQGTGSRKLGIVTQYTVRVDDPRKLDAVAKAIDAEFAHDAEPTQTSSEKAFVGRAAADVVRLVEFAGYLGWACLAAVLALVGNAIVLSVQDRVREHAVLQTLGFKGGLIARLIVAEGLLIGVIGGLVGTGIALAVIRYTGLTLSNEGLSVRMRADGGVMLIGLAVAAGLGIVAGLVPAWQASRREITQCFRAV
ncbi:MAG TPA: ABC transporter permease [Tepidisphaeraceae bacterium]|nr:ABC transporter permease [Tepidisphaeraceae bacterium]